MALCCDDDVTRRERGARPMDAGNGSPPGGAVARGPMGALRGDAARGRGGVTATVSRTVLQQKGAAS